MALQKKFEKVRVTRPQKKILNVYCRLRLWPAEANPAIDDPLFEKEIMAIYEENEDPIGERIMKMKTSFAGQAQKIINTFEEENGFLNNSLLDDAVIWVKENITTT